MIQDLKELLSLVPSIDEILRTSTVARIAEIAGLRRATDLAREAAESVRKELRERSVTDPTRESLLKESERRVDAAWRLEQRSGIRRVINATGVVIHTNLGRAPLSAKAREAIVAASGYCNLEYDLETGRRGRRGARAEILLAEITGAEASLIVNNCAAAAFLVLRVLAGGGEVIISRGELVEIGGDFRVPDVLAESGARLHEVGTTNRTKVEDYRRAINVETQMILRVHPSNYRIVGFTSAPEVSELAQLARENGLVLYEDAGSGALRDLSEFGLGDEPIISRSIRDGADIVTFSGDKLFGGVQAGLIVGRAERIDEIRRHPLYRALRIDKLAYAAIEATLEAYRRDELSEIPVMRMLSMPIGEIESRAKRLADRLNENANLSAELVSGDSVVGGGSAPLARRPTCLVSLTHESLSASALDAALRASDPPVIARIEDERVLLDLRTVEENDDDDLARMLAILGDGR